MHNVTPKPAPPLPRQKEPSMIRKESQAEIMTQPGYVLISEQGIDCCGFGFDYQSPHFDGCRMGQLLPMMWAQSKLTGLLQGALIDELSVTSENWCDDEESADPELMGKAFAHMIMSQSPFKLGTQDSADFIHGLRLELTRLDQNWAK